MLQRRLRRRNFGVLCNGEPQITRGYRFQRRGRAVRDMHVRVFVSRDCSVQCHLAKSLSHVSTLTFPKHHTATHLPHIARSIGKACYGSMESFEKGHKHTTAAMHNTTQKAGLIPGLAATLSRQARDEVFMVHQLAAARRRLEASGAGHTAVTLDAAAAAPAPRAARPRAAAAAGIDQPRGQPVDKAVLHDRNVCWFQEGLRIGSIDSSKIRDGRWWRLRIPLDELSRELSACLQSYGATATAAAREHVVEPNSIQLYGSMSLQREGNTRIVSVPAAASDHAAAYETHLQSVLGLPHVCLTGEGAERYIGRVCCIFTYNDAVVRDVFGREAGEDDTSPVVPRLFVLLHNLQVNREPGLDAHLGTIDLRAGAYDRFVVQPVGAVTRLVRVLPWLRWNGQQRLEGGIYSRSGILLE